MTNPIIAEKSKIAQEFLWKIAERYCEINGEKLDEIKKLSDITDFSFYGDTVVFQAPNISNGMYDVAMTYAKNSNMVFKAADCCGDSWVLQMGSIDDEFLPDAFKENVAIGGMVIDKQAWKANHKYYNSL